jgi:two-component system response regulator YesN
VNRQGGSSFVDYVNALRIGAAKELIKTTEMTVDEICGAVGFTNRWTMLRAFKRFVGMTPQNYRLYSAAK